MIDFAGLLWLLLRACASARGRLLAENLALRHQLAVYRRTVRRPRLRQRDRILWAWLSRLWRDWPTALVVVQPETVVRWHQQGFRLYWRWKSRSAKTGRPNVERTVQELIRRMCRENPLWGAPRIQAELRLLDHDVAESTVGRYMIRPRKPPSQTWKSFLANHAHEIVALDFFVVPTATFRLLYCFLVLSHDRRRVLHFGVTAHPTSTWTAQQLVEVFPYDVAPRFVLHDRDSIYGDIFKQRVKSLGIEEVITAPRSPWQNPYVERLIGSIRRECLDHVIVFNEAHLKRTLSSYFDYYHASRPHMGLGGNSPLPRDVEPPERGPIVAVPQVGGLHHRYTRCAA
ncbi:MAG TPA: integrase core domain-containing protein [Planctomycetaceae bacterium]|jgi:putative transposase|nr:integrase core domain-containing protein [Planctomycetaceae bacterium]